MQKELISIRTEIYELAALIARYWFALLAVLIVIRAWRMTIVDNRRARTLRDIAVSTGQLGELVVTKGSGKARRGMKYPILQEGMIGSSARADIRIRASGVRKRHAHFRLQSDGLLLTSIGGAPLAFAEGKSGKKLLATDGDSLVFGNVTLLCVLFDGQTAQVHERVTAPPPERERYDELDFGPDSGYERARRRSAGAADEFRPGRGEGDVSYDEYDASSALDDPFMLEKEDVWQRPKPTRRRSKRR